MEISIRRWKSGDVAEMARICNRADRTYLSDRLPSPYTERDAENYLNMVEKRNGNDGLFCAVIADGEVAGTISVECMQDICRCVGEIGYFLDKDYCSRGIMTEAVKLICAEAFEKLGLSRITGFVFAPNTASRRVLEKNGFALEGIMRRAALKDGKFYDLCVYGKLK